MIVNKYLCFIAILAFYSCSTLKNKPMNGFVKRNELLKKPQAAWFTKEYDAYVVHKNHSIPKDSISILVFFGDWCSDSHTQVPRFIKIAESYGLSYELYGLDRTKKSVLGKEQGKEILRVPMFIVYKNKQEIGRIIETPEGSLEQNIEKILRSD